MTQNTLLLQEPDRIKEIIPLLKQNITHEQIAKQLNTSRSTIERTLTNFVKSEEFNTWLKEEWLRVHNVMLDLDQKECYRALTALIKRSDNVNINQVNVASIKVSFSSDELQQSKPIDVSNKQLTE